MMKEFDCIVCPMSCHIQVNVSQDQIQSIQGNACPRGEAFVRSEVTCPMRMVTTTLRINNAIHPLLPVITSTNIPKSKIFDIIAICQTLEVHAPIHVGDILVKNIADTGADLIASRTMEMRNQIHGSKNTTCHQ